ncbi:hypothetical protein AB0A71_35470 [Kitasatospora aureofaciens]|uniref:hypothetical protein n=1 Tax=Kitasatospora aureofaciens TaxID=1894 RepID=UPI0033CD4DCF
METTSGLGLHLGQPWPGLLPPDRRPVLVLPAAAASQLFLLTPPIQLASDL